MWFMMRLYMCMFVFLNIHIRTLSQATWATQGSRMICMLLDGYYYYYYMWQCISIRMSGGLQFKRGPPSLPAFLWGFCGVD